MVISIGDMAGKKRVFVLTLAALAVGSLLAAVASSITVMIIARVIQGVGGGMVPVAFGIIRDEFPAGKVAGAALTDACERILTDPTIAYVHIRSKYNCFQCRVDRG